MQVFRIELQGEAATSIAGRVPFTFTFHYAIMEPDAPPKAASFVANTLNWNTWSNWRLLLSGAARTLKTVVTIVDGVNAGEVGEDSWNNFTGSAAPSGLPWTCSVMIRRWSTVDPPRRRGRVFLFPVADSWFVDSDGFEQQVSLTNPHMLGIAAKMKLWYFGPVYKMYPVIYHRDLGTSSIIDATSIYPYPVVQRRRRPQRLR